MKHGSRLYRNLLFLVDRKFQVDYRQMLKCDADGSDERFTLFSLFRLKCLSGIVNSNEEYVFFHETG